MGTEVFYCSRCQVRLFGHQFLEGGAIRIGDQVSCSACLGDLIAPLPLAEQESILNRVRMVREGESADVPSGAEDEFFELDDSVAAEDPAGGEEDFFELDTPERRKSSSSTGLRPVTGGQEPVVTGGTIGMLFFVGMVVLLGVLGSLFYFFGSKPQPPGPGEFVRSPAPAPADPGPVTPSVRRTAPAGKPLTREDLAREELEKARTFAKESPKDLSGQQSRFQKALSAAEGTPLMDEVRKEIGALRERQKEILAEELAPLDKDVAAAVQKEEFKGAQDLLEEARKKHPYGDWSTAIDTRIRDVGVAAWKVFVPLRDKAVEAKGRKAETEVKAAQDRVARWGLSSFVRELDRSLAAEPGGVAAPAPTPAPPAPDTTPLSAEAKAYQAPWAAAMALAATRDYDAAIVLLSRAAQTLTEDAVKKEHERDLALLRQVQAAHRDALQAIAVWPRGERITLEYFDENLRPMRLVDPFVRSDADTVEVLSGGAPQPVETAELTARGLSHLYRSRAGAKAESDAVPCTVFCLLEGDVDAARQNLNGPADRIPWKYWSLGARLQEARSGGGDAGQRELAARKLYFSAERDHREPRLRAAAIQSYRQLLNEFADAAIVKRRRSHIAARRDGAKDWVHLAGDMDTRGTFKAARNAKVGECWTSAADTADPVKSAENFAEVRFYAFPETAYRCWFYVGGCCQETFASFFQATGATHTDPSSKEVLSAEPGGSVALPIKHSISFLKKTHEDHQGPKEPKRWEWIEVRLPKYSEAGIKAVRLITDQKGFSVAHAVVSSTRSGPPGETEMKGWLKKAEPEAVVAVPAPGPATAPAPEAPAGPPEIKEGLAGLWRFDEGTRSASDSSGNDNAGLLVNGPERGPGRWGQSVLLDGKDRHVSLPNAPVLDALHEGSYSISCWFRPDSKPAGQGEANDAAYAVLVKSPFHEGLTYTNDGRYIMDHWLANGTAVGATSAQSFSPGAFHHVAGVVNKATGTVQVFVNGRLESAVSFAAGSAARDFGKETWKIGIAAPGAATRKFAANGAVDEVRLYTRALTINEVRTLAAIAPAAVPTLVIASPGDGDSVEPGSSVAITTKVTASDRVAKVEFLAGSSVIGTDASAPYAFTWAKVPPGTHVLTARLTTKDGTVLASAPVTIKAGVVSFYRAFNLGGDAASVEGMSFEGKAAKGLTTNGIPLTIKAAAFMPPPEGARATLLKSAVVHTQGTSVSIIGIPNGQYLLFLTVVEDGAPQTYDLAAENKVVHAKYKSGTAGSWARLGPWLVDVNDGLLDVEARGGAANFAALEIWKVGK